MRPCQADNDGHDKSPKDSTERGNHAEDGGIIGTVPKRAHELCGESARGVERPHAAAEGQDQAPPGRIYRASSWPCWRHRRPGSMMFQQFSLATHLLISLFSPGCKLPLDSAAASSWPKDLP